MKAFDLLHVTEQPAHRIARLRNLAKEGVFWRAFKVFTTLLGVLTLAVDGWFLWELMPPHGGGRIEIPEEWITVLVIGLLLCGSLFIAGAWNAASRPKLAGWLLVVPSGIVLLAQGASVFSSLYMTMQDTMINNQTWLEDLVVLAVAAVPFALGVHLLWQTSDDHPGDRRPDRSVQRFGS